MTYRVEGTAAIASILYLNGPNLISIPQATLPWSIEIDVPADALVQVMAENLSETGTVRCAILVSGFATPIAEHNNTLSANCETTLP